MVYVIEDERQWHNEILGSPLLRRCRVAQEFFLSPRVLFFTAEQLWWACATLPVASELHPDGVCAFPGAALAPMALRDDSKTWRSDTYTFRAPLDARLDRRLEVDSIWGRVVHRFSHGRLAHPRDKLAALTAERLAERGWRRGPLRAVRDDPAYAFASGLTRAEAGPGAGRALVRVVDAAVRSAPGHALLSVRAGHVRLVGWLLAIAALDPVPAPRLQAADTPLRHALWLLSPRGAACEEELAEGRLWLDTRAAVRAAARRFGLPNVARTYRGDFALWGLVLARHGAAAGRYRRVGRFHVTRSGAAARLMERAANARLAGEEYEAEGTMGGIIRSRSCSRVV